jgi:hypothetical protein
MGHSFKFQETAHNEDYIYLTQNLRTQLNELRIRLHLIVDQKDNVCKNLT